MSHFSESSHYVTEKCHQKLSPPSPIKTSAHLKHDHLDNGGLA